MVSNNKYKEITMNYLSRKIVWTPRMNTETQKKYPGPHASWFLLWFVNFYFFFPGIICWGLDWHFAGSAKYYYLTWKGIESMDLGPTPWKATGATLALGRFAFHFQFHNTMDFERNFAGVDVVSDETFTFNNPCSVRYLAQ